MVFVGLGPVRDHVQEVVHLGPGDLLVVVDIQGVEDIVRLSPLAFGQGLIFNADGSGFDVALVRGRLNGFGFLELAAGVRGAGLVVVRVFGCLAHVTDVERLELLARFEEPWESHGVGVLEGGHAVQVLGAGHVAVLVGVGVVIYTVCVCVCVCVRVLVLLLVLVPVCVRVLREKERERKRRVKGGYVPVRDGLVLR